MTYETIRTEIDGLVATLTLDRGRHNGMTERMVIETYDFLSSVATNSSVRVLVLTGNGSTFCPGADLDHVRGGVPDADLSLEHFRSAVLLHEMPAVTVAALNGSCAGAGLGWALACDLRIARRSAKFKVAFASVGVAGDMGGCWTLPRLIGAARARDIYLLDDKFDATRALEIGLVTQVVDDDAFDDGVAALVRRLVDIPPEVLSTIKANFVAAERMGFADYIDLESERHLRLMARPEGRDRF